MNEAEELYHKIIENYDACNYMAEQEGIELIEQYGQQARRETLDEFQNQKFFHALPPAAKDEFYEWIYQEEQ